MVRKVNEYSLSDALQQYLEEKKLMPKLLSKKVVTDWSQIVGQPIADQTKEIWIAKEILYLKIENPAWKNELSYAKSKLIVRINEYVGKEIIKDIRIS